MVIHEGYDNLKLVRPVVTLGIFDGVHLGHRYLLQRLVSEAKEARGESVVITFHPHPRIVLEKNNRNLSFLSTRDEKIRLLEKASIDHLIFIDFNLEFSKMEACNFINDILVGKIGTKHLIIGHDHHFGYRGEGNFQTIQDCASLMGFRIEQVTGLSRAKGTVSSSLIRDALVNGRLDEANELLGYCYSLKGSVVEGRKIGRKLGYPTANINPSWHYKLIPADGVYAVEIMIDNLKFPGMLSIGTNPTVNLNGGKRSIEVNIFNFNEVIYEKDIEVVFRYRLREERLFESLEKLAEQMRKDREEAIRLLS
jgi:riboflavin kinase / FMN adenylyltransferase